MNISQNNFPLKITFTIQNIEELTALYHVFNVDPESVVEDALNYPVEEEEIENILEVGCNYLKNLRSQYD